ncbi:MAG: hypothetical protein R3B99_19710 [Polyangiales bacterium]
MGRASGGARAVRSVAMRAVVLRAIVSVRDARADRSHDRSHALALPPPSHPKLTLLHVAHRVLRAPDDRAAPRGPVRTLVALLLAALALACTGEERTWARVHHEPAAALLAIAHTHLGTFAVGADDGTSATVLHAEDADFARAAVDVRGTLWWVAEAADGSVALVGEGPTVLRTTDEAWRTAERWRTEPVEGAEGTTLYGIWEGTNERFAVGGDVLRDEARGVLLRRDASGAWAPDPRVASEHLEGALFKVWGRADDDVWVVGERGMVLHFDGTEWTRVASPVRTRLLTVHGAEGADPIVVGGASNGVLLEHEAGALVEHSPEWMPTLSGVFVRDDRAVVVGSDGVVLHRTRGQWVLDETTTATIDFHAVALRSDDAIWAVGGNLSSPALDGGEIWVWR